MICLETKSQTLAGVAEKVEKVGLETQSHCSFLCDLESNLIPLKSVSSSVKTQVILPLG